MQPMILWETAAWLQLWCTCACLCVGTCFIGVCVSVCVDACLFWLWSDTWCSFVVPPISARRLPPLSFYRKLIGSCHWCVKLLCVGQRRQLDYLFFIFSILEQLPLALLLFLNEILSPNVVLKETVCKCSKLSLSWRFGILSYNVWPVYYFVFNTDIYCEYICTKTMN